MRISPSKEQTDYLVAIGVIDSGNGIKKTGKPPVVAPKAAFSPSRNALTPAIGSSGFGAAMFIAALILFLIITCILASANETGAGSIANPEPHEDMQELPVTVDDETELKPVGNADNKLAAETELRDECDGNPTDVYPYDEGVVRERQNSITLDQVNASIQNLRRVFFNRLNAISNELDVIQTQVQTLDYRNETALQFSRIKNTLAGQADRLSRLNRVADNLGEKIVDTRAAVNDIGPTISSQIRNDFIRIQARQLSLANEIAENRTAIAWDLYQVTQNGLLQSIVSTGLCLLILLFTITLQAKLARDYNERIGYDKPSLIDRVGGNGQAILFDAAEQSFRKTARSPIGSDQTRDQGTRNDLTSQELTAQIVLDASRVGFLKCKPVIRSGKWGASLVSVKGNVRSDNQDCGVCFGIGACDVVILADGCGGCPHGQRASQLAVRNAAVSIIRSLGNGKKKCARDVEKAFDDATRNANHALLAEGEKLNVTTICGGLRTTLILVVRTADTIHYCYIGDGGGYVIRSSGECEQFLAPQKAGNQSNVLAASLGPVIEGKFVYGKMDSRPGDLVVAGTDGIFDRFCDPSPQKDAELKRELLKDILREAITSRGDLQLVTESICTELAGQRDSAGYICDDNITLALMGTGKPPKLPPGFWNERNTSHGKTPADRVVLQT
jgi:serine/threonine protein phosphatase PrpC